MFKKFDGFVLVMTALVATVVRDVVVFTGSVGIAQTAGEIGDDISVEVVGVYEFPSVDAEEVAVGTSMYWDIADGVASVDADSGTNILIGTSWTAKASAEVASVNIKIG